MSRAIPPRAIPPRPGLEREEPELSQEYDISPHERAQVSSNAKYGITAVRYVGAQPVEAMMGLIDGRRALWELQPTPTRLSEVVDRLVEGDTIISLFPDGAGGLELGPEVKVDVLPEGTETLALVGAMPGRGLHDLPRF